MTGEEAPTATEYAVMLALLLMGSFAAFAAFGQALDKKYDTIVQAVDVAN